jgi:AraC family transcriptional regulator
MFQAQAQSSLFSDYNLPAIHPVETYKDGWVLTEQEIYAGGLLVQHAIQPPDTFDLPAFSHHLLFVELRGVSRVVYRFNQQEYDGIMPTGHCILIPAAMPSFVHWESTDEGIFLIIDPQFLHKIALENDCFHANRLEIKPMLIGTDSQISALALQFHQERQNQALGGRMYSEALANLLSIHLLRHYCTTRPTLRTYARGLSKQRLQHTLDYIQAHLDEKLSLEEIAAELNLSIYYFCELFTQSMGIPPYKYVLQQRVERAKLLLKQSKKSLTEIAFECGFAHQSHLNRHFRKLTGVTPKQYRDL